LAISQVPSWTTIFGGFGYCHRLRQTLLCRLPQIIESTRNRSFASGDERRAVWREDACWSSKATPKLPPHFSGKQLRLNRGGIDERWFASTT
jgi:hypothetical protein